MLTVLLIINVFMFVLMTATAIMIMTRKLGENDINIICNFGMEEKEEA